MKCIAKGFIGTLIVLVLAVLIVPQYCDYQAAVETASWLNQVATIKDSIEENIIRNKTTIGSGAGVRPPKFSEHPPSYARVTDNGEIFLKGGREGQLVVLIPAIKDSQVEWACIGGSSKATRSCRDSP